MPDINYGEIIVYQSDDGLTRVDVRFEGNTVWLTQAQLIDLYHSSKSNISEHIRHIFEDGELNQEAVVRKFRTTAADGKNYQVMYYNLDMIILTRADPRKRNMYLFARKYPATKDNQTHNCKEETACWQSEPKPRILL